MSRISIDVTQQEHQRLKAMAALQGKTIKQFVLASTIGAPANETKDLAELEALLRSRLKQVEAGQVSTRTASEIFDEVIREAESGPDV